MTFRRFLLLPLCGLLSACNADSGRDSVKDSYQAELAGALGQCESVGLISRAELADGKQVEFWRLQNNEGGCSYMAFLPHSEATAENPLPVVIYTKPYVGIDWTGEEVDERWAQEASAGGHYPDQDQPDVSDDSSGISYKLHSLEDFTATTSIAHINNVSAAYAFGRFYAGGNIDNDIGDMVAAIDTISERSDVDADNVAVTGGSWGGFEALYGSAYAEHVPKVTVALYPVISLYTLSSWVEGGIQALDPARADVFTGFYEPYLRRVRSSIGDELSEEALGRYNANELCERLNATLVIHDTWDMIIPHSSSMEFSESCQSATLISLAHLSPFEPAGADFNHRKHRSQYGVSIIEPLRFDYIFRAFNLEPRVIPYGPESLYDYLTVLKNLPADQEFARNDMYQALLRLMDESVYLFDFNGSEKHGDGASIILEAYNDIWETQVKVDALKTMLMAGE